MFFIINAIMGISIYFTLASGQLSLGAAGFMSVGAYVGAILSLKADLPIVVGIIIGGLVASLVAVIIGLPTTRLKGLYATLSITTPKTAQLTIANRRDKKIFNPNPFIA